MNSIIICNNNIKKKILKDLNNKPLCNIKFMTKREFIHNYYFDYDNKTIYYLMNKYQYKYDIALEYLNNLYYVEDQDYQNDKLNRLVSLKKELDNHNLLIYNSLFKGYLKDKKIIFMDYLDQFDMHYINELKDVCNIDIKKRDIKNYQPFVYEFNTIDEEVEYVAYKICELIDKGVSPDKIKITNINRDYDSIIKRIFNMYNLKIQDKQSLYGMNITKCFLDNYNSSIDKTIDIIKDKYDSNLVNKIINIVNQYSFIDDYIKVKDLIIEDIKRCIIKTNYHNQIEIVDYHDIFDLEYVFLMNFNEENIPLKYQDIDYINDNIKPNYLETSIEKNKKEVNFISRFIKNTKNLIITYKLKSPFASFYPSSMIDSLGLEVEEGNINKNISYSCLAGSINTCIMYDDYYKYGIKNKDLSLYKYNYPINYNSYNNQFSGINNFNEDIILSYTSMDSYYKCSFKYYLDRILKINIDTNTLAHVIGSTCHYVLEKCLYSNIDYKSIIREYLYNNSITLNIKEKFFLEKITAELPYIMKIIKDFDKYIKLNKRLFEKQVVIEFGNDKFMGVIDKVIYEKDKYVIVDYKTGNTDIKLDMLDYGIGIQLPVYLYLAHKQFGGHIVGFYLNQIIHGNIKYDIKKSYDEIYKDNLKLYGYSNKLYINEFDDSFMDSKIIKSLKVKNDGEFYSYAKVLNDNEIEEILEKVEDKIITCFDLIHEAKFNINPKNINGKNISCEYCPYKDICFKKTEDIIYLGGINNA